jgi:hypothetical protein
VGERVEPLLRRAMGVEVALLFFGRDTDLALDLRIGDDDKLPRLLICA